MIYQISSGLNSPEECEMAVAGFFNNIIKKKDNDPRVLIIYRDKHRVYNQNYAKSIMFDSDYNFDDLLGTIQWIYTTKRTKRKNWFIDFSKIPEVEIIDDSVQEQIIFKTTHSSGPGGQNINKVESAVYATHINTGITVFSNSERDQYANKKNCIKKIAAIIKQLNIDNQANQKNKAWKEHNTLVRGNAIKVYEGKSFKEKR